MTSSHRDERGRFARRPIENVDAESRFDPMGDDIPFRDTSGEPSPSTIERPRYAPEADDLAPGAYSSPLRPRRAVLVSAEDADHTIYGRDQGALTRAAARAGHGDMDPVLALTDPYGAHRDRMMGVSEVG